MCARPPTRASARKPRRILLRRRSREASTAGTKRRRSPARPARCSTTATAPRRSCSGAVSESTVCCGWAAATGTTALGAAANEAWDTDHYLRGYYADGTPLGASGAAACRIDSVAQSFAAFSPYADRDRVQTALTAALAGLRDGERRLIRIYAPAFLPEERAPGYVSTYGPGFRENGGQYTHAAVWLALALHRAGRREEAAALAEEMALSLTAPEYGAEPFVLPADIAYAPGKEGRAGWSWYTGAAGWYLRLLRELYGAEP